MTSRLGVLLECAIQSPGVVAAVLAHADGGVIENAARAENDQVRWGAVASAMLRRWTLAGLDLGMGGIRSLMIEEAGGPAMIAPVESDVVLLVVGDQTCRPGHLRLAAKHATAALGELARTGLEPETNVVPQFGKHLDPPPPTTQTAEHLDPPQPTTQIAEHLDPLPPATQTAEHLDPPSPTLEEGSAPTPPAPPNVTTGEVVLIGAHTFRLVTKLVTHLLKMRGVRSSRLRAYSPGSTIIDVVLEDGATLAAIDRRSLEEFSIERTEEQGTRLVLRADNDSPISPDRIGSRG